LNYQLIPDYEECWGEIEYFDGIPESEDPLTYLTKKIDEIFDNDEDVSPDVLASIVKLFNDTFHEKRADPSYTIIAYGYLSEYVDKVMDKIAEEYDEDELDEYFPAMRELVKNKNNLAAIKKLMLDLHRDP